MDRLLFPLPTPLDPARLRQETLGETTILQTPYGPRRMIYADYTASGRNLRFVEDALLQVETLYANTHTEDNESGSHTTRLYHQARHEIRELLGGTDDYVVVLAGTGATGAVHRLTQILGVCESPATRMRLLHVEDTLAQTKPAFADAILHLRALRAAKRPVVFLTPYEHHSNVLPWREADADVVEIGLTPSGQPDLADLEEKVASARYAGRLKIGSFSAASNVTGRISPVREMARIMHGHCGLAFFDYAASAPYVPIRVWESETDFLDGIFLSPHKFLGGPGASGLLLFHRRIYDETLPPSLPGGGTVDYVNGAVQDYKHDVETREDAGTPPILQALRTAMVLQVKEAVGAKRIVAIEQAYRQRALDAWTRHPHFEGIGLVGQNTIESAPSSQTSSTVEKQDDFLAILSFNLRYGKGMLHPRFVTRLLNDLFGIQARAGCSCAGPFGHRLLGIGEEKSARFREAIRSGCEAMKPGWVRIGFHYTMEEATFQYIVDAVLFLAEHGADFLPEYRLDPSSGLWTHRGEPGETIAAIPDPLTEAERLRLRCLEAYGMPSEKTVSLFGMDRWPDLAWFPVAP